MSPTRSQSQTSVAAEARRPERCTRTAGGEAGAPRVAARRMAAVFAVSAAADELSL